MLTAASTVLCPLNSMHTAVCVHRTQCAVCVHSTQCCVCTQCYTGVQSQKAVSA